MLTFRALALRQNGSDKRCEEKNTALVVIGVVFARTFSPHDTCASSSRGELKVDL